MTHGLTQGHRAIALTLFLSWLLLAVPPSPAQTAPPPSDPRTMKFDPVAFTVPDVERTVLENGIIVYLLPDRELPLVTISAMIRAGAVYEPAEKVGLAGLTGTVMRTGGTARMTGDQVDEELEYLAAHLSVGIGDEAGSASLDIQKKDFARGLAIFADILRNPAFDPAKVELAKRQTLETIRRRPDNPAGITAREFRKLLYGANHPLGRESTVDTVSRITRDDLVAFQREFFAPNTLMLGVTGDFEKPAMLAALRQAFGDWPARPATLPLIPPVTGFSPDGTPTAADGARSVNILRRDITQTHLRVGHLSIRENDPDYFALSLLEDILGGNSFTNRLFRDVRSRQGLAYSVGSRLAAGHLGPGAFMLHALTKGTTTHQALTTMLQHMERLRQEAVSDEELRQAKDAFLNSFVFSFADAGQITGRLMALEYYGLPKDFLQQFRDSVVRLTKDDLLRVARTHLHPDRVIILAVGKDDTFDQSLSTFGRITILTLKPGG
jgi:predicted Zn-dependent peptidase